MTALLRFFEGVVAFLGLLSGSAPAELAPVPVRSTYGSTYGSRRSSR